LNPRRQRKEQGYQTSQAQLHEDLFQLLPRVVVIPDRKTMLARLQAIPIASDRSYAGKGFAVFAGEAILLVMRGVAFYAIGSTGSRFIPSRIVMTYLAGY
jgi:hypothetical protein